MANLLEEISKALIQILNIKNIERFPLLEKGLKAVILAAASGDYFKTGESARLHLLFSGPSAVGKAVLAKSSEALNQITVSIQASKLTVAGLCGYGNKTGSTWLHNPGWASLADRGILIIQDFQEIPRSQTRGIHGALGDIMVEGRVIDASAAHHKYPALASIHIDLNKKTDLFPNMGPLPLQQDIGFPIRLLRRFDIHIDFPADAERQFQIALELLEPTKSYPKPPSPTDDSKRLKELIASLKERHPSIEIPEDVANVMKSIAKSLINESFEVTDKHPRFCDFMIPTILTFQKLVFARCRLSDRSKATIDDVEGVQDFLHLKLNFISKLLIDIETPQIYNKLRGDNLRVWMKERFKGKTLQLCEIVKIVKSELDFPPSERTLLRVLKDRDITQVGHGLYKFEK